MIRRIAVVILSVLLISVCGCQSRDENQTITQQDSGIGITGAVTSDAIDMTSEERIIAVLDIYQSALLDLTDAYLTLDTAHINLFLQNPNIDPSQIPDFFNQTEPEMRRIKIALLDADVSLNTLRYDRATSITQEPLFLFVDEFGSFVNAQYKDFDNLRMIAQQKYHTIEQKDHEPGVYGVHHMYQKKNKQVAEQAILLLEKYIDTLHFKDLGVESENKTSVEIPQVLTILDRYLYKNIGWP